MTWLIGAGGGGGGGGGKGGGGSSQRTPSTAPDSLDSTAYAKIIDLLSEGEIQGLKDSHKSIFFNNTPLQNADGSYNFQINNDSITTRNGTQNQAFIPRTAAISNEVPVNVTVPKTSPVTRSITASDTDAVRVTVTVPQLQSVSNEGDVNGTSIQLQISTQVNGGSFVTQIEDTITGRTGDAYQRDYIIGLSGPFPVNVRVTRVTADSTDPKLTNAFTWTSYTEITYNKLRYPNSALVALRVDAEQFNSIPTRSYLIRGIKVRIPSNATVDSTTGALIYSGVWDGTFAAAQWTSDPAWCLWDLLTSKRYGFGQFLDSTQLDKWSFYAASVYCSALNTRPGGSTNDYNATTGRHGIPDGLGNYEPRFSCNVNIQTAEDAYKLVNDMCSVFRAMPYWSAGSLTLTQDAPGTRSYFFSLSNVTEEGFTYAGSSQKTRSTVAVVKYFDIAMRDYAYEVVEDQSGIAKYGAVTKEIEAFACTSRGQAHRLGEWLLYSERYETEVVSFTASLEAGVLVRPGQIIAIADPVRSGVRRGGRIKAVSGSTITLDDATGLTLGTNPRLYVMLPDGTVDYRSVSSISGNILTLSSAFATAPNVNAAWLFQNDAILPTRWRVLSVKEEEPSLYSITALAWDSGKYDYVERGVALQPRTVTTLNQVPATPSSLTFNESLYTYQNDVRSMLSAEWLPVPGISEYEVQWRKDKGNWNIERVRGPLHEILNTTPGLFEYRIFSINSAGLPSASPLQGSTTALGKTAPPAAVTGFTAVLDPDIGVTLNWDKSTELDLQGYEIWQGASWGTGTKIGLFQTTSAKIGLLPTGTITWYIKALDTSEVYSTTAASASITIGAATAPSVTNSFKGTDVELKWSAVAGGLSTQHYELRYGSTSSTWATATPAGTVQGTVFLTKANWSGVRRWFVAAVDAKGNVGAAGQTDAQVNLPTQPSITQQVIDNNVLLQWNDCTQTLPIDAYELRKGNAWATATVIGTKQGRFTSVFEVASGTYTYWLAGIDSAGNYGTPGSVTAVVNQPPDYQLQLNFNSTFSGTKTNVAVEGGNLVAAVNTTETWQSHFTSRGWTTLQNQVSAGYPYYAMPSATTGSYVETIDYGSTLAGTKVTAALTSQVVAGSLTLTPTLSTSLNGTTWTDYAGISEVYATNFRYIKIRYDFASAGGDDLLTASALNIRLDAKLKQDFGNGTANAADSGGTTVSFNTTFVDVQAISVTPLTTTAVIAVYDFNDVPNPTTFKVLLFNTSGTRVSGAFSWSARGV
jgi:predicted phage tail protein